MLILRIKFYDSNIHEKTPFVLRLDGPRQELINQRTVTEKANPLSHLKQKTTISFTNLGFALWLAKDILNNLQEIHNCSIH